MIVDKYILYKCVVINNLQMNNVKMQNIKINPVFLRIYIHVVSLNNYKYNTID